MVHTSNHTHMPKRTRSKKPQTKKEESLLVRLLHEMGFTDNEITVYLALSEHGSLTIPALVRLTGIHRTTVYSVTDQLLDKGVIAEDAAMRKSGFMALPPENLLTIADRYEADLRQLRGKAERIVIELNKLNVKSAYPVPKVLLVQEDQIAEHMQSQADRLAEDALRFGNGTVWGFTDQTYLERYWDTVQTFLSHQKIRQVKLRLIGERGTAEHNLKQNGFTHRQIKFWHAHLDFTCSLWVYGTFVVMVITRQRPYYLLEIHDEVLANNLRLVFQGLWETIPEGD